MSSISEITRQVQEAGLYDKQQCPHCGLPFNRRQNDIDCYRCGSSYSDTLKPNWARSMTCLQIENGQLREMFRKANLHALNLADRIKRLEGIIDRAANRFFADGPDGQTAAEMLKILEEVREAKP